MALLFLLFFFALLHYPSLSFATDTISASQSLSWRQNITSEGGKFVLGFFSPPGSSSGKYYVGIWYNKISLLTPVWVANREIPLTDPATAELKISHDDGNLVLLSQSRTVVWSSNIASISANSTVAVILDNGNLELRDASNSSRVFWQSFDYPSDTWLSGSRLGINKVTNRSQYISSWKNKDDPAPGMFSLQMDPLGTSQFFLFWNLSTKYWATGIWDGEIFTLVPEMSGDNPIFKHLFQHINDSEGHFFTYAVPNGNITTRLAVDYASGRIQALTWMEDSKSWMPFWARPAEQCSVHALCGPFGSCNDFTTPFCNCVTGFRAKSQTDSDLGDRTGGCVRNTPLQCSQNSSSNSEEDGFFEMPNVKLPENSRTLAAVRSLQDCESACLKNCSCTAFSYSAGGCLVWYGDFLNLQEQYNQSDGSTFHLRLAASELQSSEGKKEVVSPVIIGVVVAAAVLACLAVVIWIIMGRRGKSRQMIRKSKVVGSSLQTGESGFDFFPTLATSKLVAGDLQSLIDEKQMGDADLEELERACKLACWCIQDDENCRPTMGQAVQVLEGILEVGMPPVPRSLNAGTTDNVDFFELPSELSS
ncbi:G-type lectin S-receptor-like serine/threonine-protein kinase [Canna indica]|uniref:G-type lectin S-receptor-like serine/threonine-protein kinase n=1 Tax=Canna indica TaxID=4628 RepID=A0AAQ3KQR0_9LILI|nr:G-type lectin S-receptor-like serine/threonine-protein kinase [Canna indica]